jgi:hypothetical protein
MNSHAAAKSRRTNARSMHFPHGCHDLVTESSLRGPCKNCVSLKKLRQALCESDGLQKQWPLTAQRRRRNDAPDHRPERRAWASEGANAQTKPCHPIKGLMAERHGVADQVTTMHRQPISAA